MHVLMNFYELKRGIFMLTIGTSNKRTFLLSLKNTQKMICSRVSIALAGSGCSYSRFETLGTIYSEHMNEKRDNLIPESILLGAAQWIPRILGSHYQTLVGLALDWWVDSLGKQISAHWIK